MIASFEDGAEAHNDWDARCPIPINTITVEASNLLVRSRRPSCLHGGDKQPRRRIIFILLNIGRQRIDVFEMINIKRATLKVEELSEEGKDRWRSREVLGV